MVEASYVGNLNRHLDELIDINMPAWGAMWLPQNQDPASRALKTWMAAARCRPTSTGPWRASTA